MNLNDLLNDKNLFPAEFKFGVDPSTGKLPALSVLISSLFEVAILITAFLSFIWFIWGAFQYIFAGGNKDGLGKARSRMTWAIAGLAITILAYLIAQFAQQILQPRGGSPIL